MLKTRKRKILSLIMSAITIFNITTYADDPNIDGGGTGTSENMWAVSGRNGGFVYDGEGLRIYQTTHHNAVFCSPKCKNQFNIYKSRGKK